MLKQLKRWCPIHYSFSSYHSWSSCSCEFCTELKHLKRFILITLIFDVIPIIVMFMNQTVSIRIQNFISVGVVGFNLIWTNRRIIFNKLFNLRVMSRFVKDSVMDVFITNKARNPQLSNARLIFDEGQEIIFTMNTVLFRMIDTRVYVLEYLSANGEILHKVDSRGIYRQLRQQVNPVDDILKILLSVFGPVQPHELFQEMFLCLHQNMNSKSTNNSIDKSINKSKSKSNRKSHGKKKK